MIQLLDEDTRSNYGAGLLRFTQFCDLHNIPESNCMPASSNILAAFLASVAGTVSSSAANSWMAGLHYWHSVNGADWHGGESDVLPLSQLALGLDLNNSFNIAVFATACVAFWSCCRLGKLVIPSLNVFDSVKHITPSILPISVLDTDNTTNTEGADISVTGHAHPTCPLNALVHHLQHNLNIPSHAPLFSFERAEGSWSPLTKPWFLVRCNEIWVAAGHPSLPGHAFCIGGATELLLEGVHPDVVTTQGRWKSCAFLEYWRQIESILPLFISTAVNSPLAIARLESTMHTFQCSHSLPNSALSRV
ncbi:DNA breaking-rejoining enzyme [Suillus placidus]|uniref:DNA breaking-rejoining enzyme n=1 Tax=Suillus placidus TaxID=48579 RepID=A0A9P6ZTX0_9AGAM|nr:DNA breaking-rejoining enzyme [Suillus placidus]